MFILSNEYETVLVSQLHSVHLIWLRMS